MERPFVGINFVIITKNQTHSDVYQFVTGQEAALHGVFDPLLDRLYVFPGNRAPRNLVFEYKAFTGRWFDLNFNVSELPATPRLFLVNLFTRRRLSNSFAISNLRFAHICFDAKLTLHSINNDLKVKLSHAGNNGLPGFMIR